MTDPEYEVIAAARRWWRYHRPVAWNEAEHRAQPTVNIPDPAGQRLAQAVAADLASEPEIVAEGGPR